jgi:hypothetical protein
VFDPDFSDALEKVAFHTPVWMIDTPQNRTAAEQAWRTAIEWPHISVTLFREDDWRVLLDQIALRERFDVVEAFGAALNPAARDALTRSGFVRIETTVSGFRARK